MIETDRLILRHWRAEDRDGYAGLTADPEVMYWLGGVMTREQSDAHVDRMEARREKLGYDRFVIERKADGLFLGFAGAAPTYEGLPIAPSVEMGWRLVRTAWGQGYAAEAARAAVADCFGRMGFEEILAYTAQGNLRSQAVMGRAGFVRDPDRDFKHPGVALEDPLAHVIVYSQAAGMIETERMILRPWRDGEQPILAALNADPEVAYWIGGVMTRDQSDAMFDRVTTHFDQYGFGLWAMQRKSDGEVLGFNGLAHVRAGYLPVGPAVENGWRMARHAWGGGYASEGAAAALAWGLANLDVAEIISFTANTNVRSEAVMRRIGMIRDASRDFDHPNLAADHPLRPHIVYAAARPPTAAPSARS